ncbi:hypothetical protein JOF53_004646 [Crossiella equi]|uniref:Uncharacterized protein n=1 Tax=Crossiella equi TaxID=130796 RepID=A0ABS5AGR4_9PSEU|nr:hypothetical protein [Crossiella equi]MBP2475774.1 hypothetical protein [Crossiella equi]
MDEHKLADAFRDAVREVPPPSFGEQDVVQASHRASARQRRLVLSGSAFGVVLLAGGTLAVSTLFGPSSDPQIASGASTTAQEGTVLGGEATPFSDQQDEPRSPQGSGSAKPPIPPSTSKQGEVPGGGGPSTAGTEGCGLADRDLAAALAAEIPAARTLTAEQVPAGYCTSGARGAAVSTPEGKLMVVLAPSAGAPLDRDVHTFEQDGLRGVTMNTPKGAPLTVYSLAAKPGKAGPFGDDLARLVKALSDKF